MNELPPLQSASGKKQQLPPLHKKSSQLEESKQRVQSDNEEQQFEEEKVNQNIQFDQVSQPRSQSKQERPSRRIISSNNFQPSQNREKNIVQKGQFTEKSTFLCFFCGGTSCKKERAEQNPHPNPIDGLHCDWITDHILAMQRPNQQIMLRYQLHPNCGPGLIQETGFTYNPEEFQKNGINYFNYGWKDMDITTFENLMRVVSAFQLVFENGKKMAVHCHAGTGRTGVSIAAWLIYGERMTATQAIKLFQEKRHGSLSKSAHQKLLKDFENFLNNNRRCFDFPKLPLLSLEELINTQNKVLIGRDKSQARFLPIAMHVILNRLKELLELNKMSSEEICACFVDLDNEIFFKDKWSILFEQELWRYRELFNQHDFQLGNVSDMRILCQLLLDFFDKLPKKAISDDAAIIIANELQERNDLKEIFLDPRIVKLLGKYQFEILNKTAIFGSILQQAQPDIDRSLIRKLMIRFSISYLQKRKYLDKCFFRRSLLDISLITMEAVIDLSEVMIQMSSMNNDQLEKGESQINNRQGQFKTSQIKSTIEMDFLKLTNTIRNTTLDGKKSSKITPILT